MNTVTQVVTEWKKLYEDRSPRTRRLVEHLILGGIPEEAAQAVTSDSNDEPLGEHIAIRAREIKRIMGLISSGDISPEAWERVDTVITRLRSEGVENLTELLKASKMELCVLGLDEILKEHIDQQLSRFALPQNWGQTWRSTIGQRSTYAIENQEGDHLIARVSKDTRLDARLAWYSPSKGYGVGIVDGIVEEGAVYNRVRLRPAAVMCEQGLVTSSFGTISLKVKGCPVIPLTESAYTRLYNSLVPSTSTLAIGIQTSNGRPLMRNGDPYLYEEEVDLLLSDLESRIPIIGLPGSGKTTAANQLLRQVMMKTSLPVIAIAPSAPNLAEFGGKPEVVQNDRWNIGGVGASYIAQMGSTSLKDFRLLTLSEGHSLPDLERLHPQTILELLISISSSPQVRAIWASRLANNSPKEVLDLASSGHLFRQEDGFEPQQARTAQRYATILREMFGASKSTVDLSQYVDRKKMPCKGLGIFIPADSNFVCELTLIVLSEIFHRSQNTHDPKSEGMIVALDEIPFLYQHSGSVIPGKATVEFFGRLNLQGRNRGLLLAGLMQDERYMRFSFPGNPEDYPRYYAHRQGEARILSTPRARAWIPPVGYKAAA